MNHNGILEEAIAKYSQDRQNKEKIRDIFNAFIECIVENSRFFVPLYFHEAAFTLPPDFDTRESRYFRSDYVLTIKPIQFTADDGEKSLLLFTSENAGKDFVNPSSSYACVPIKDLSAMFFDMKGVDSIILNFGPGQFSLMKEVFQMLLSEADKRMGS